MKLSTKFALSSLLCALAMPAAHAATASVTVDASQFKLTDLTAGTSTLLSWAGFTGGSISATAAAYSGDNTSATSGVNLTTYSTVAGHSYIITLPYTLVANALSAGDIFAFASLSLGTTNGDTALTSSTLPPAFSFTGDTSTSSGTLSLDFVSSLTGSTGVSVSAKAFAAAAAPVPEADATLMSLAGLAVIGGVVVRRRHAQGR
jgi:hypothetical protein